MKNNSIHLFLLTLAFSCNKNVKIIKTEIPSKIQILREGEWKKSADSLSGISIREDKLAFFKNMNFSSKDIYKYKITDSIYTVDDKIVKKDNYLKLIDYNDTIYYRVKIVTESISILSKDKKGIYILKTK